MNASASVIISTIVPWLKTPVFQQAQLRVFFVVLDFFWLNLGLLKGPLDGFWVFVGFKLLE